MMIIGGIPMMTITTIGQAQSGRREPNPGTIVQQNRRVQVVNGNLLLQLASHFHFRARPFVENVNIVPLWKDIDGRFVCLRQSGCATHSIR